MKMRNALKSSTAAINIHHLQNPAPAGMARLRYSDGEVLDVPVRDGVVLVPRDGDVEITYDVRGRGLAA